MILPSVTQVLSPWSDFSGIRPEVLAHAAERGTAVHAACAAYAQGLWVPSLDEECHGPFESFKLWFNRTVDVVLCCEKQFIDEGLGFTGTPDLVVMLKGETASLVVDLKTPVSVAKSWAPQIAAYRHLTKADRAGTLRLSKTGLVPIFNEYQPKGEDWQAFLNCLGAYRYFHKGD